MAESLDIEHMLSPEHLATEISSKWSEWNTLRQQWVNERRELRNYLYATDTSTTSNAKLPWSNSTTTPKLTQIKDNLHANLFSALFPSQNYLRWQGTTFDDNSKAKKQIITSFMKAKLSEQSFPSVASQFLDDVIDYGNAFGFVKYERDYIKKEDGDIIEKFVGPRAIRISPFDICFNPTASSFAKSPKVVRSLLTLGDVKRLIEKENQEDLNPVFERMLTNRQSVLDSTDVTKGDAYRADGFSDIKHYYGSGYVEILTFYGDLYDTSSGTLMTDRTIRIMDRAYLLSNEENPSWLGTAPFFHVGWRERPDNLYAMGPLDNLVGMQYRIDHLENLKADVFDMISLPMMKIRGSVEDFEIAPGARIYEGEEGSVEYLRPDGTALNADFQISQLENKMEEMAGAPRQAMGIRTPGEKTAFEVQSLDNASGRIFQHKSAHIERTFFEPMFNYMLAEASRNMSTKEQLRVEEAGRTAFVTIEKADVTGEGRLKSIGARHFAERAQRVQNLQALQQVRQSDPTVGAHISGKKIAEIMSDELGEQDLYGENITIQEQMETQQASVEAQVDFEEQQQVATELGI
jgi:hypothetical protein